jgi:hypothetical protein
MTKRKARPEPNPAPAVFSIGWPPGFRSSIVVDPKTRKFETDFARTQRHRENGGWDSHPLTQPGNVAYVSTGPVKMMERAK